MGFVKHAFLLSMYFLQRCTEPACKPVEEVYSWAMFQTVLLAGDSDTNAAIVGGVIGAYVGVDNINEAYLKKLLECNLKNPTAQDFPYSRFRPNFIQPALGCIDEMLELVRIAPGSPLQTVSQYVDQGLTIK